MNRLFRPLYIVSVCVGAISSVTGECAAADRITFYKDVLPIFQENCQECHRPEGTNYGGMVAPFSLFTFEEARPWAKSIARQVEARTMPPWHAASEHHGTFSNERTLTEHEIGMVRRWADNGAPKGNPVDAPEPRAFVNHGGWMIGTPDLIVKMPEPFYVEDDVVDVYTAFSVDLTDELLPQDMWITAFQCKPGSSVIHHFNCHLLPPIDGKLPPSRTSSISKTISPEGAGQYIGGVSSGTDANVYPEGFGLPLRQGTRVTFDIHYHKEAGEGTGLWDQSEIGFLLTDKAPERRLGGGAGPLMRFDININPGESRHQIGPVSAVFKKDADIISLMPHMHMRGTAATFEFFYPDGTNEIMLNVPNYDFSWQTVYYLKEFKRVPAGTRVEYTAWYDNSLEMAADRGFDSNQTVRFGPSSTDEMMMGFIMSADVE